jgi:hypothetical protein
MSLLWWAEIAKDFARTKHALGEDVMADDEGVRRRDVLKGLGVTGAVAGFVATTAPLQFVRLRHNPRMFMP